METASPARGHVLVVGAGRADGIGFASARLLAAQGWRVALADLPQSQAHALARELPGTGHGAHAIDITDEASVHAAIEEVEARFGRLDGLVIAAAIHRPEPFLQTSLALWEQVLKVNATGTFLVAQAAARSMAKTGGGRIVAVGSIVARQPQLTAMAYGVSKAAVMQLVRYMALELASQGITVNAVLPGSTATSMLGSDPERLRIVVEGDAKHARLGIPLGHLAAPEDQAAAIAFLLSEQARHITGQMLAVDGGQTFF